LSLSGQFIPAVKVISDLSWFVGFISAFLIYLGLKKMVSKKEPATVNQSLNQDIKEE